MESTGSTGHRGTWTEYNDADRTTTVKGDLHTCGDEQLHTVTYYDQLGRVTMTWQSEDGSGPGAWVWPTGMSANGIKTRTVEQYPARVNGQYIGERLTLTTTPFRDIYYSDATLEWNCTQYDTLGRIVRISTFVSTQPTSCASMQPFFID